MKFTTEQLKALSWTTRQIQSRKNAGKITSVSRGVYEISEDVMEEYGIPVKPIADDTDFLDGPVDFSSPKEEEVKQEPQVSNHSAVKLYLSLYEATYGAPRTITMSEQNDLIITSKKFGDTKEYMAYLNSLFTSPSLKGMVSPNLVSSDKSINRYKLNQAPIPKQTTIERIEDSLKELERWAARQFDGVIFKHLDMIGTFTAGLEWVIYYHDSQKDDFLESMNAYEIPGFEEAVVRTIEMAKQMGFTDQSFKK